MKKKIPSLVMDGIGREGTNGFREGTAAAVDHQRLSQHFTHKTLLRNKT